MKLRQKQPINYSQLHEGPKLRATKSRQESWSTSKLWRFDVIEYTEDKIKVHWEGWLSAFDQWISKESAVDIPESVDKSDAFTHLTEQLKIQVCKKVIFFRL